MINFFENYDDNEGRKFATDHLCFYNSSFVTNNKKYILSDLKKVVEEYTEKYKVENMTWDYQNYNIFNLCIFSDHIRHLQKLIHQYIFLYFDEMKIENQGFTIQAWVNYHTKDSQILPMHTHLIPFHGFVCLEGLNSETIFSSWDRKDIFSVKNESGNIYLNASNLYTLHRVEMNSTEPFTTPRVSIAFDFMPMPFSSERIKFSSRNPSFYNVYR